MNDTFERSDADELAARGQSGPATPETGEHSEHTQHELAHFRDLYLREVAQHRKVSRELAELRSSRGFRLVSKVLWPISSTLVPRPARWLFRTLRRRRSKNAAGWLPPSGQARFFCKLDTDLSRPLAGGQGNIVCLTGRCWHTHKPVRELSLLIDGEPQKILRHSLAEPLALEDAEALIESGGNSLTSGFWAGLNFASGPAPRKLRLGLRAVLADGELAEAELGQLLIAASTRTETDQLARAQTGEPLVAICMATYNPALDLFVRQIESLRQQTHRNWVCVISDDCSDESSFQGIRKTVESDARFELHRNSARVGFYRNFERALALAPAHAEFIAFCDQDDRWYPDKLAASLEAFQPRTKLVFSDMDIVTRGGQIISRTFWKSRRNNFTDLETLLFANTVTGGTLVFRGELLRDCLPFPVLSMEVFHDHWIACVALSKGEIAYLDRPLQAYTQHGENVHGYARGRPAEFWAEAAALGQLSSSISVDAPDFAIRLSHAKRAYYDSFVKVILLARALKLRAGDIARPKQSVLDRVASFEHSLPALTFTALRMRMRRRPTMGMESAALFAALRMRTLTNYCQRERPSICERVRSGPEETGVDPNLEIDFIEQKIAPLKLSVSSDVPRRVNILVSEINFQYLFGGYLCVFNLAQALKREGFQVRLVLVDRCDYRPDEWKLRLSEYEGLSDLLDRVETAYVFDRANRLAVSPEDRFMATSWWTAHIAHRAAQELAHDKFLYLIQEYEPLFYPAGSYGALAEQAITFPHDPIFSTDVLHDFFQQRSMGIFARRRNGQPAPRAIVIRNAISRFRVSTEEMRNRNPRRLLFYARPDARYTARNAFEMGILALREVIREGHFDLEGWRFFGIGGFERYKPVSLARGVELEMLPNVSQKEFARMLPRHDLGLSLMLSPHTSLMPLEMAAAGLVTVTNTYANKTSERITAISSNLIAVPPTVAGLKQGLISAIAASDDFDARVAGAKLNWSSDWNETFTPEIMAEIRTRLGAPARG